MARSTGEGPVVTVSGSGGVTDDASQVISGTAFAADGSAAGLMGRSVEIDDNGKPVSTATVACDGSWTADVALTTLGLNALTASVTDANGVTGTSGALTFDLEPVLSPPSGGSAAVDSRKVVFASHDAVMSGLDGRNAFVFKPHPGDVMIGGFTAAGRDDRLNFSHASFASVADILHSTTQSGHDAVIHLSPTDTVTLVGVSRAELRAHPGSFAFHG